MNNQEYALNLLDHLVGFQTIRGNVEETSQCFAYIQNELTNIPYDVKKYESNGVQSVLWRAPQKKKILLNAHIDVVPASPEMFSMKKSKTKVTGRGVADMKFGVASFITVLKDLYQKTGTVPPIDMLLTSDEEVGGANGTGYFVTTENPEYKVIIIPDGGENWHIVEEAKGVLHLKLETSGKSAHAAHPWEGVSAADSLIKDLAKLRDSFSNPVTESWQTTLNIGQIHSGTQTNQVADQGLAMIDIRYIPSESKQQLKDKVINICPNSKVTPTVEADPFKIDKEHELIQQWAKLISDYNQGNLFTNEHGASDGRYFSQKGTPVILSQPILGGIHTETEWLDIQSFHNYTDLLEKYLSGTLL